MKLKDNTVRMSVRVAIKKIVLTAKAADIKVDSLCAHNALRALTKMKPTAAESRLLYREVEKLNANTNHSHLKAVPRALKSVRSMSIKPIS